MTKADEIRPGDFIVGKDSGNALIVNSVGWVGRRVLLHTEFGTFSHERYDTLLVVRGTMG